MSSTFILYICSTIIIQILDKYIKQQDMRNTGLLVLAKKNDVENTARKADMNRGYVGECLADPENFKGSSAAKEKILKAFEEVIAERKANEDAAQARFARLLNEAEA